MFDWAAYKRTKGAVKLHLVLDNGSLLAQFAVIANREESACDGGQDNEVLAQSDAGVRARL